MMGATPDVDKIMAYEQGDLDVEETIELFGQLVESGMAWKLQGTYGRTAMSLINQGIIDRDGTVHMDRYHDLKVGRE